MAGNIRLSSHLQAVNGLKLSPHLQNDSDITKLKYGVSFLDTNDYNTITDGEASKIEKFKGHMGNILTYLDTNTDAKQKINSIIKEYFDKYSCTFNTIPVYVQNNLNKKINEYLQELVLSMTGDVLFSLNGKDNDISIQCRYKDTDTLNQCYRDYTSRNTIFIKPYDKDISTGKRPVVIVKNGSDDVGEHEDPETIYSKAEELEKAVA